MNLRISSKEKKLFFQVASSHLGLPVHIIEKDFWVCWILKLLFSLDDIKDNLTFKGGTSLSKVYKKIKRFSEDIDISIEKTYLGFEGNKDPSHVGRKKADNLIKELGESCKYFVQNVLKEKLEEVISKEFPEQIFKHENDWKLRIDQEDKDGQTLLFYYPIDQKVISEYIRPFVKIEMGARGEHWPVEINKITPYVAEGVPDGISKKEFELKVLSIERTFWEKATILHMYANYPEDKDIPPKQSRHYYDIHCLVNSNNIKAASLENIELLKKVAEHKKLYFRSGWANYEHAKNKKTLKIIPPERILNEMEKDYKKMREMFFEEPPIWEDIIKSLTEFEKSLKS